MVAELERTPPRVLDGVPETLSYLVARHRMILFTQGEPAEQAGKGGALRPARIFRRHRNRRGKKRRRLISHLMNRHHVVKSHGWMVGNNPRSDINPALQAGLERGALCRTRELGARPRGTAKRPRQTVDRRAIPRSARSFLSAIISTCRRYTRYESRACHERIGVTSGSTSRSDLPERSRPGPAAARGRCAPAQQALEWKKFPHLIPDDTYFGLPNRVRASLAQDNWRQARARSPSRRAPSRLRRSRDGPRLAA